MFHENLKRLQQERRLSVTALARELQMHTRTIWAYRKGDELPSFRTLQKLAFVLGCSLADLVADHPPLHPHAS